MAFHVHLPHMPNDNYITEDWDGSKWTEQPPRLYIDFGAVQIKYADIIFVFDRNHHRVAGQVAGFRYIVKVIILFLFHFTCFQLFILMSLFDSR